MAATVPKTDEPTARGAALKEGLAEGEEEVPLPVEEPEVPLLLPAPLPVEEEPEPEEPAPEVAEVRGVEATGVEERKPEAELALGITVETTLGTTLVLQSWEALLPEAAEALEAAEPEEALVAPEPAAAVDEPGSPEPAAAVDELEAAELELEPEAEQRRS